MNRAWWAPCARRPGDSRRWSVSPRPWTCGWRRFTPGSLWRGSGSHALDPESRLRRRQHRCCGTKWSGARRGRVGRGSTGSGSHAPNRDSRRYDAGEICVVAPKGRVRDAVGGPRSTGSGSLRQTPIRGATTQATSRWRGLALGKVGRGDPRRALIVVLVSVVHVVFVGGLARPFGCWGARSRREGASARVAEASSVTSLG